MEETGTEVEAIEEATVVDVVAEGDEVGDEAMVEVDEATVEEAVEAKIANPSQNSLAPRSTSSSAQACQSRAVAPFPGRSAR